MPTGFVFYSGSYAISFDSEKGVSLHDTSPTKPRRNALVASEETVTNYLTEYGVNNVKSVKLVEVKFPKNAYARQCNNLLQLFAESMVEETKQVKNHSDRLLKYCGVDIDY